MRSSAWSRPTGGVEVEAPTVPMGMQDGQDDILVVDDDPMVLPVCQDILRQWGYGVIAADSVVDARHKFVSRVEGVPLAIIDTNLSDGAAVDLAKELVELSPGLRIIFVTGQVERVVPAELEQHVCARLAKPFRLGTLAITVSATLSATLPGNE